MVQSLAFRIIKQIVGDKRTLLLLFGAPILILTLLSLLLGETHHIPHLAIDPTQTPDMLLSALENEDIYFTFVEIDEGFNHQFFLKEHTEVDGLLNFNASGITLHLYEASVESSAALSTIQGVMSRINESPQLEVSFVVGDVDEPLFNSMGFAFLAIISFFLIFIISGMSLVKERSTGTLERMLMTPIKRHQVIAGFTLGFSFFAIIQSIILVVFSIFILQMYVKGSFLLVMVVMLLLAITAVSFGNFISIFAHTEFQVVQFIPIAIIPQVFFSGIISIETFPYPLQFLAYVMPVFYGSTALRDIMRIGSELTAIWPHMLGLVGYVIVLSFINTVALKKYRSS